MKPGSQKDKNVRASKKEKKKRRYSDSCRPKNTYKIRVQN